MKKKATSKSKKKLIKKKVSRKKQIQPRKRATRKNISKKKKIVKKKITKKKVSANKKQKINYLNPGQISYWIEILKLRISNFQDDILVIPKKSKLVGSLNNKRAIIVFGDVDGEIYSSNIIIAKGSKCTGTINGETVTILGNVQSEITVKNQCFVKKTAVVKGDIYYNETINIESGAKILGSLYPKKKPLALPNYSKSIQQNNSNLIDLRINETDQSLSANRSSFANNINTQSKPKGTLDKIISKIFS